MITSWKSLKEKPEFGDEYLVVWKLDDGEYPVVTSMDYDKIKDIWTDPRSNDTAIHPSSLIFWTNLPEAPKNIPKEVWEIKEFTEPFVPHTLNDFERTVYGQCPHGENMTRCSKCNPYNTSL